MVNKNAMKPKWIFYGEKKMAVHRKQVWYVDVVIWNLFQNIVPKETQYKKKMNFLRRKENILANKSVVKLKHVDEPK